MPHSVMNTLTQTSRRLISRISVEVGDSICCKKWKSKINASLPQVDEIEKAPDSQDENEKATDSVTPKRVIERLKKTTAEPEWLKRFYKVDHAENAVNEIFQSDYEDDEDPNNLIK